MAKKSAGRPKIAIDLEKAESYASLGLSEEHIAAALGISQDTLARRKAENAELADALKRGKAKGVAFVAKQLMENVKARKEASIFFFLKTQAGWKETSVHEHTGKDGAPIEYKKIQDMTDDELLAIAAGSSAGTSD